MYDVPVLTFVISSEYNFPSKDHLEPEISDDESWK
jgi:hypothetical protein